MTALYTVLLLILPISALVARRLLLGDVVRMALVWVAIFGMLFVFMLLWLKATGTGA